MKLIQMTDSINMLQEKQLQHLQNKTLDILKSKAIAKDHLKTLQSEIETMQEKLSLVSKTLEVKYEELKEGGSVSYNLNVS
jgi:hypothetical protein